MNMDMEEKELELMRLSVIQIQIRSQIPGVLGVNGPYTIPVQVPVVKKWTEVFQMEKVQVRMNPKNHILWGRNHEIDVNTEVFDYFIQFMRNRSVYTVDINPRPPPKDEDSKKSAKRRKGKSLLKPQPKRVAKSTQGPAAIEPDRTRSQRRGAYNKSMTSNNQPLPVSKTKEIAARRRRQKRSPSAPVVAGPQEEERPHQSPAAFTSGNGNISIFRPNEPNHGVPHLIQSQGNRLQDRFVFRDESTQAGEHLTAGEADVKRGIIQYIQQHVSNRDMLDMRQELNALKKEKKFQSLNRLIRYTSGFLQNAFVDDHS